MKDYIDLCQCKNIQPEMPFKGSLNIRLGQDLHRRTAIAAEKQKLSINKFIANILSQQLLTVYKEAH